MADLCDFSRETITFQEYIPKERRRQYYQLHFSVPENVCRIDIEYSYKRQGNIIDLALLDYAGNYVGSSGSDKEHISISGWASTPGYRRTETKAGEWAVIIGAYQVQDTGVNVTYRVTYTYRQRTLLKGDTHVHTTASDGSLETGSVVSAARKSGLDYIFITDHNNDSQNDRLPMESDITVLPGMEWTHYDGHAGLLGVQRPINNAFCINHEEEAWELLDQARQNGAVVVLNHPFCPACGWHFGMERDGYDMIELINGDLEYSFNRECLIWWHQKLCEGKRIPVLGGSDFHRFDGMHCIGKPQTCIYAFSPSPDDIISALRHGNGYVAVQGGAPSLWAESSGKILGEEASRGDNVEIQFKDLLKGDTLRLVTDCDAEEIDCKENRSFMELQRIYPKAKFVRFEVVRDGKEILISNPLYFGQNKKVYEGMEERMQREELYRLIGLPEEMTGRLRAVEAAVNLEETEEELRRMMERSTAAAAYESLEVRLGADEDHLAMLYCQLECGRRMYERYREKGISQAVYADTMKCFTRFMEECGKKNGRMFFDRGWWTYRQVSMSLFRIGTLEFELEESGKEKVIAVHIPSDADLSEQAVDSSFEQAGAFFKAFYPDYRYEKYTCDSWLLSPVLKELLPEQSNIVRFQQRFVLTERNEGEKEYMEWLFQVPADTAYQELPERTTLQRKAKALLLAGGNIGTACGFIEASK